MTVPPEFEQSAVRDRVRSTIGDQTPVDVDDLAAAADQEIEQTPVRRTLAQLVIAAIVSALVLVLLLLASVTWVRTAVVDAENGTECTGAGCVEVELSGLSLPGPGGFPPGTTVIASNRYTVLHDQFIYFEVRMPAGAPLPVLDEPWINEPAQGAEPNRNASRMIGRGYTHVHWSGGVAAGTDDDGSIVLIGGMRLSN